MLSSAAQWVTYGADEDYYALGDGVLDVLQWISTTAGHAYLIVCGLGLCVLGRNERRYPDRSREVRVIVRTAGILVISLGLFQTFRTPASWVALPAWARYTVSRLLCPWIPVIIGLMASTYALGLAKRGGSRRLTKMSQLPAWPIGVGLNLWLFGFDRMIWPLRSLVWEWLLPLAVVAVLVPTILLLWRGAREAQANWCTDL
jgi:hypothetical protein